MSMLNVDYTFKRTIEGGKHIYIKPCAELERSKGNIFSKFRFKVNNLKRSFKITAKKHLKGSVLNFN